jgi:hypothetical protein
MNAPLSNQARLTRDEEPEEYRSQVDRSAFVMPSIVGVTVPLKRGTVSVVNFDPRQVIPLGDCFFRGFY